MSPGIVLAKAVALSFARAFVGVFAVVELLPLTDVKALTALGIAAAAAGLTAAFRTVQALLTNAEPTDQHVN